MLRNDKTAQTFFQQTFIHIKSWIYQRVQQTTKSLNQKIFQKEDKQTQSLQDCSKEYVCRLHEQANTLTCERQTYRDVIPVIQATQYFTCVIHFIISIITEKFVATSFEFSIYIQNVSFLHFKTGLHNNNVSTALKSCFRLSNVLDCFSIYLSYYCFLWHLLV